MVQEVSVWMLLFLARDDLEPESSRNSAARVLLWAVKRGGELPGEITTSSFLEILKYRCH